jgi:hypothetical protein
MTVSPCLEMATLSIGADLWYTLAGRRGGWGVNIWKTREIGLPSYNDLSTPQTHEHEQVLSLSQSSCVSLVELTDGRGGTEG